MAGLKLPGLGGWSDDPLWAGVYDWTVEHPTLGGALWAVGIQSDLRLLYAAAAEIGTLVAGSRVLDVPCGGGVALRGLQPDQGLEYVAADIAQTMLERTMESARERGVAEQVVPRIADVEDLPFEDDSFDMVVSFTGLHCFPDPARAVMEMMRVLKPGGVDLRERPAQRLGAAARADASRRPPGGPARAGLRRHRDRAVAPRPGRRGTAARAVRRDGLLPRDQGLSLARERWRSSSGSFSAPAEKLPLMSRSFVTEAGVADIPQRHRPDTRPSDESPPRANAERMRLAV